MCLFGYIRPLYYNIWVCFMRETPALCYLGLFYISRPMGLSYVLFLAQCCLNDVVMSMANFFAIHM